jgi:hypothetical protein
MSLKLKSAALAVSVTVLAGGAAALNASAELKDVHFISETAWTTLFASQGEGKLKLHDPDFEEAFEEGDTVASCEVASGGASVGNSTTTELTFTLSYKECTNPFGEAVTVTTNECHYLLKSGTTENRGDVQLICPSGKKVEVLLKAGLLGTCLYKVSPGTITNGHIVYTTVGEGKNQHVVADITVKPLMEKSQTGFGCLGKVGTTEKVEFTGKVTVKGLDTSASPTGISVSPSYYSPPQTFRSEASHTQLEGLQVVANKYTFGILIGDVECGSASFGGTMSSKDVSELSLAPSYSECEGLSRQVTPKLNGCTYLLEGTTNTGKDSPVRIQCPEGKSIELVYDNFTGGCTITVGAQTPTGVVDYEEKGSGSSRDLVLTWTLSGIKYKRDGCEVGGEGSNGTYTGTATLKGEDEAEKQLGLWLE